MLQNLRKLDVHIKSLNIICYQIPCKVKGFLFCGFFFLKKMLHYYRQSPCDKWVPVTTAWRVLRLRMEERPPIWRVAANKLNKLSQTADEGWSSSLGVGRGANNASPWKPRARCFLWRQNNLEVNYSPTRISGGGSVSRGSTMRQAMEKGTLF